jgi:hypothetical protein
MVVAALFFTVSGVFAIVWWSRDEQFALAGEITLGLTLVSAGIFAAVVGVALFRDKL